jgi:hypothetical protein
MFSPQHSILNVLYLLFIMFTINQKFFHVVLPSSNEYNDTITIYEGRIATSEDVDSVQSVEGKVTLLRYKVTQPIINVVGTF